MTEDIPTISRDEWLKAIKAERSSSAPMPQRRRFLKYVVAAVVSGVVAGAGTWALTPPPAAAPPTTVTHTVTTTPTVTTTATVTKTVTATPTPTPGVELNFYTTGHAGFFYDQKPFKPLESYTKETGIKINYWTDSWFDLYRKQITTFAAGVYAWDVAYAYDNTLGALHEHYLPLDEMGIEFQKEMEEDMLYQCRGAARYGGHWYGLPRTAVTNNLIANKDILDAKGLEFPTTFEEFLEACEAVHEPDKGIYAFNIGIKQGWTFPVYIPFLHGNGGSLWAKDERRTVICDSREAIRALEDFVYVYQNYMPAGAIEQIADLEAGPSFVKGKHVFELWLINHVTAVLDPETKVKNVQAWLWPGKKGVVRSGSSGASEAYVIPRTALHKKEAWDLIRYLASKEVQVQMFLSNWWTVAGQENLPIRYSYLEDERLQKYPFNEMIKAQLEQQKYRIAWYGRPAAFAILAILEPELVNALKGVKSPEDAMKDAAEAIDPIVEEEYSKYGGGYVIPYEEAHGML